MIVTFQWTACGVGEQGSTPAMGFLDVVVADGDVCGGGQVNRRPVAATSGGYCQCPCTFAPSAHLSWPALNCSMAVWTSPVAPV